MPANFAVSTDFVARRDRYAFWRESISGPLTGMTMEYPKQHRENFWARMSGARTATAGYMQIERASSPVHRSASDIDRHPSDNLLIYMAPRARSWFSPHEGDDFIAEPGSIVIGYSDVAFSHAPVDADKYQCILASLPCVGVEGMRRGQRHPLPKAISPTSGIGALFASYFDTWRNSLGTLDRQAEAKSTRTLAQLAAMAFGTVDPRHDGSREAAGVATLLAAKRCIAANVHRPDLSPALVAAALGISVRRLHMLFEPTGDSFSRSVQEMRIDGARKTLIAWPDMPVTEIAFRCGYDSLATFYRVFKATYGLTATEYREAMRGRHMVAAQ